MRQVLNTLGGSRIVRFSGLMPRRKTLTAMSLIAVASFAIATYANKVVVQQVQPIAGNHVQVPAPELQVLNTFWNINLNLSLVTGLILNLTTVGGPGLTGSKLYSISIQVSCLTTTAVATPNCAIGHVSVKLPVNLNGVAVLIPVSIAPSIDPERTEIDDLSFIVTSVPDATLMFPWNSAVLPSCLSDFSMLKEPSFIVLPPVTGTSGSSSAPTTVFLYSLCNYTGSVTLTASAPAGISATFSTNPIPVPKNGFATLTETIISDGTLLPGIYTITDTATDAFGNIHTWPLTVQVT